MKKSWWEKKWSAARGQELAKPGVSARRGRLRPCVEALEDRTTPAPFVVPSGYTLSAITSGGVFAGRHLAGIAEDPVSRDLYIAHTPDGVFGGGTFMLHRITAGGLIQFVGTYSTFGSSSEVINLEFGPDGHIYRADATPRILRIQASTGIESVYNSGLGGVSGGTFRYGLEFEADGDLIYMPEAAQNFFYRVLPGAGANFLGTYATSAFDHGDSFGIQPDGDYVVYPDTCNGAATPSRVFELPTAGHVDGTNYTLNYLSPTNLRTLYGDPLCGYSNGAIDPATGDVFAITANFGNGISRITHTPGLGGPSTVFVDMIGNGVIGFGGRGVTDLEMGPRRDGASGTCLYFLDDFTDTIYEVCGFGAGSDFDDLPASFGTAEHTTTGVLLGALRDSEPGTFNTAGASGDDFDNLDDEDGLNFITTTVPGGNARLQVNASGAGRVDAWFDWNNNGSFDPVTERITPPAGFVVGVGNNNIDFSVPLSATQGVNVGVRVRISSAGGLLPTGTAADGEVEDYLHTTSFCPNVVYVSPTFTNPPGTLVDGDLFQAGAQNAFIGSTAFTTMQQAFAVVCPGGTIIVNAGTYNEVTLNINKQVTIDGANPDKTQAVFDPTAGVGFNVTIAGVLIRDLRITGATDGIAVSAVATFTAENVQSDTNTDDGIDADNVDTLRLTDFCALDNRNHGAELTNISNAIVLRGVYNRNFDNGIDLNTGGVASFTDVDASDNNTAPGADTGLNVSNINTLTVTRGTYRRNFSDGINVGPGVVVASFFDVFAEFNGFDGLNADDATATVVTIQGGSYSSNRDDGIELIGKAMGAPVLNVQASTNGDNGFRGLNITTAITFVNGTYNDNGTIVGGGDGIELTNTGPVSTNGVVALRNDPGISVNGAPSFTAIGGNIQFNDDHGIALANISGNVSLTGVVASNNDADFNGAGDGVNISGTFGGNLSVTGGGFVDSDGAGGAGSQRFGIRVLSTMTGSVSATGPIVTGNRDDGFHIADGGTTATLNSGQYSNNGRDGIRLNSFSGLVQLNTVQAVDNGSDGFEGTLLTAAVDVDNGTYSNNRAHGFNLVSHFTALTIDNGTYDNNTLNGIHVDGNLAASTARLTNVGPDGNLVDGAFVIELLSLTLNGGTYNANRDDGLDVDDVTTILVGNLSGAQFNVNGGHGIELFGGAGLDDLFRTATILRSQMINNNLAGIFVDADTNPADCAGDTTVFIGTAAGNGNRIEDNDIGIDVHGGCVIAKFNDIGDFGGGLGNRVGAQLSDADGFLQLECNQIHGNGTGVANVVGGGSVVEAILNWWGGGAPNTAGNDTTSGTVNFAPWAINADCTGVPPPTITSDGDLIVAGSSGRDTIVVTEVGDNVVVSIRRGTSTTFLKSAITGHIVIYGFNGADSITVSGEMVSEIHGGAGNDVISGGSAKDIIWGDDGNDYLQGQLGDDVLIGGRGRDRLSAGSGLDILLGGDICKGNRHNGVEAYNFDVLCKISEDYLAGICDADLAGGLTDDIDDTEVDRFTGGYDHDTLAGGDWFLANMVAPGAIDVITDFLAPDKLTEY
jgi:hypothetical protein